MIDGAMQLDLPAASLHADAACAMPCFVVGRENALLQGALDALISECSNAQFNPLVLAGEPGSGKSHLLRAAARHWSDRHGSEAVRYFSAVDFGRDVQWKSAEGAVDAWRNELSGIRFLALDDLHQLRPRIPIQRELCRLIDDVIDRGGKAAIATEQEPALLRTLGAGLCDRLAAGLTVRIRPPGIDARRMMLDIAAQQRQIFPAPGHISKLAEQVEGPAAQILAAAAHLDGMPLDRMPPEGLPDSVAASQPPSLKEIIAVASRYFSVTQSAVLGPGRRRTLIEARRQIVHLARTLTKLSFAEIGRGLGGRDHSTVMHAYRQMKQQLRVDPNALAAHDALKRILQAA